MGDLPLSSDIDLTSQTETEDTDTGDLADTSSCSNDHTHDTSSSETMSILTTSSKSSTDITKPDPYHDIKKASDKRQRPANIRLEASVDLTDVTELSNMEDMSNFGRKNSGNRTDPDKGRSRTGSQNVPQLDFTSDWYNHKCFKRYWDHYNHAMSWCEKHFRTCAKLQDKYQGNHTAQSNLHNKQPMVHPYSSGAPPSWHHPYPYMYPVFTVTPQPGQSYTTPINGFNGHHSNKSPSIGSNSQRRSRRRGSKKKQSSRQVKSESSTEMMSLTEDGGDNDMEITEEMIEFFAKSQEHRNQREEAKKLEEHETIEEHINVEEVKVSNQKGPTVEAPKERPGVRRTREMKLIYGKGAAMVHGMETALQMTFDRNTDIKQPKTWPNMPLKIVFG